MSVDQRSANPESMAPVPPQSTMSPSNRRQLMRPVFEELILERRFEIAETGLGEAARLVNV